MPPFQVIDRQVDPSAQLAVETGKNITENIRQRQAMQLAIQEYKIKAQQATDEHQKQQFDQQSKILDTMFKSKEQGLPAAGAIKMLSGIYGPETTFKTLAQGGESYQNYYDSLATAVDAAPGTGIREKNFADANKATAETDQIKSSNRITDQLLGGGGGTMQGSRLNALQGNVPPGTTYAPPGSGLSIPLNSPVTSDEAMLSSTTKSVNDYTNQALKLIDQGTLNKNFANAKVSSGIPLAVKGDQKLEDLQSLITRLKPMVGFSIGGKTFSSTEQQILYSLLDMTGKSDTRVKKDLSTFPALFNQYVQGLSGGMNAVRSGAVEASGPAAPTQSGPAKPNFTEGQTYVDSKGNKAVYKNGQFVETP